MSAPPSNRRAMIRTASVEKGGSSAPSIKRLLAPSYKVVGLRALTDRAAAWSVYAP